jgi:hypothetical protein
MSSHSKKSISTILNGGLGNQMFQYATARAFALANGYDLTLNTGAFQFDYFYKRTFALGIFNIHHLVNFREDTLRANFYIKLLSLPENRLQTKRLANLFGFVERPFIYDPELFTRWRIFSNVMVGYWQDERYFVGIRDELLVDFTPSEPLTKPNQKIAEKIKDTTNSVAVHFRCNHEIATSVKPRIASDAPNVGHANLLSNLYYEKAIAEIYSRVESPKFIVFSDNPAWVKANHTCFETTSILENDRGPDWQDLILMSQCKHHIIANSSFSWWGAWLAESSNQVVVAPANYPYTPNVPSRWYQI